MVLNISSGSNPLARINIWNESQIITWSLIVFLFPPYYCSYHLDLVTLSGRKI